MNARMAAPTPVTAFFPVARNQAVVAWAISPLIAQHYPGVSAVAEDRVAYRFINGFVDVGDLPCRVALWDEIKTRDLKLDDQWQVESVNLPGFSRRLDFSGFWHRPTKLARWCRTVLKPQTSGIHAFTLTTCGGANIWVDGNHVAKVEPFTRNTAHSVTIELPLKAGGSDVVMLTEELAERDANWFVELTLVSDTQIEAGVPGTGNSKAIETLKSLAANVRPQSWFTTGDALTLVFDAPAATEVSIRAEVQQSVHMRHLPPRLKAQVFLSKGQSSVTISGVDALGNGYHELDLVFEIGGTRIDRQIGFALLDTLSPPSHPQTLAGRKAEALAYAAAHGENRIGRALAMLAIGQEPDETFSDIVLDTLAMLEERRDCSDFVMVPLLWILGAYRDALPPELCARIEKAVLGYRYWVDEPGNDVMWFWSENHVLCFHTSQYLAGRLLPEETFSASGRTGREQESLARERLNHWFASVEAHGLAEWNSAAYYPIDFIGLLALHNWAEPSIAGRARVLLDRLFVMIGLHTLGGVPTGTQGRAYDKEIHAGPLTELGPFATVAFGQGWLNDGVAALPMLCAGSYSPPKEAATYADPTPGTAINAHYVQGLGPAGQLALHKRASVQLSSSVDGEPGRKGHQQHLIDVRFSGHPFARAWINHPGEDDPWGHQRPSYWAGNGVMPRIGQYDDAALLLYDLGQTPRVDFTHICAPADAFEESELADNWLILRSGRGFAALTASAPITPVEQGPGVGREYRAYARQIAWAAIVGELAPAAGLPAVREAIGRMALEFDFNAMRATLIRPAKPKITLDYARGLSIDDAPWPFPNRNVVPGIQVLDAPYLS